MEVVFWTRVYRTGRQAVFLAAGLFLLCFCLWPGAAGAAPGAGEGDIKARVGWEGQGVPGHMLPAVVDLHNPGSNDLEGVVEVVTYYKQTFPPPPGSAPPARPPLYAPAGAYGEHLVLPAGGSKRVILWFPLRTPDKMTFRFRAGEEILGSVEEQLDVLPAAGPVTGAIGVLGQVPPALERVRFTTPDGVPRVPVILPLKAELFPAAVEYLDAFSTLVVAGFDGGTLAEEQRQALSDWVRQGGQLILAGGAGIYQSLAVLPPEDRVISVAGSRTRADWQAAAGWLGTTGGWEQAATVAELKGEGALPLGDAAGLGLEARIGAGTLLVLTFDPLLEPWRGGDLGVALWQKLLEAPATSEINLKYGGGRPAVSFNRVNDLMHHTRYLPEVTFPPSRVVGLYLLAFIILAGPVTYFWLRRRQRLEYAWLAVPLLGLVFAGGIYGYMLYSGGNVITNAVRVVSQEGRERGSTLTAVGFFAPTAANFQARLADPGVPVRVTEVGGAWEQEGEGAGPPFTIVYGNDLTVDYNYLFQWGMRTLGFRQEVSEAYQGLTADLQVEGQALVGSIYNGTGFHLDHVALLAGSDLLVIPALAPGERVPVRLEITPPPAMLDPQGYSWNRSIMDWQLFVTPAPAPRTAAGGITAIASTAAVAPGNVPLPLPPEPPRPSRRLTVDEQRRANLFNSFQYDNYHGVKNMVPLTLVAFSEAAMEDLKLAATRGRKYYLTMFYIRPALEIPAGAFTLPPGLVQPQLEATQLRSTSGYGNAMSIDEGYLIYAFRPLLPEGARIEEIIIDFSFFPAQVSPGAPARAVGPPVQQAAPVVAGALEVYNPARRRWEILAGANSFRLPGSYATPDGEVRLRVNDRQATGGQAFYFLPPMVAYQGVRE